MRNLLVANDLTNGSHHAMGRAIRLAAKTGASIRIIHSAPTTLSSFDCLTIRKRLETETRLMMEELCGRELNWSIRIRSGDPASAINREAKRIDADLVLVGAHGEPRLRDAIFGTTSMHLMRHCDYPILVVQNDDGIAYTKVMAALDDVGSAEAPLQAAMAIAPEAELFVVHAFESRLSQVFSEGDVIERVEKDQQVALDRIIRHGAPANGPAPDVRMHVIARQGEVMDVIMKSWSEIEPDLVVMATHGRSGFSHLLHGSFTEYVLLGCRSDILVTRMSDNGETAL
ncbi:universal stress protein [Sphingosinicella rhizophila]|uniref:Universal stress protein n=1 Tax=Sphingosinicella rhizophila TaxID=3050082 RepID=A0ABU3Q6R2_9SPHN|nr:universal stress protein [Sphingosinicella sp. GR2756]MDT9598997.1 universal stress protein [Sphingosinicella sp. GR2756]